MPYRIAGIDVHKKVRDRHFPSSLWVTPNLVATWPLPVKLETKRAWTSSPP